LTRTKSAADYAAIAVAPLLIFLMISSLASFLTLMLYRGGFPGRVSWILMMFTLGAVGIARIAIENDRAYSLGYAAVLGLVTFLAMLRFVDSPIFALLILALIAYLSDIIVRDCTLIDEEVDASGQGLVDSGRIFVNEQLHQASNADKAASGESVSGEDGSKRPAKKTHQPGRTVMYLALAALPLFGLGQFFLRNDAETWSRAQRLLAFYLFSSLSLLVTTSFLGLRRYLRQRRVEMPVDVSIAWMLGGLAMIAAVLLISYMAPMPGRALATFELPIEIDSPGTTVASRFGWGSEGADQASPEAAQTSAAQTPESNADKETSGETYRQGAPPGQVAQGNRKDGPAGNQGGGKSGSQTSAGSQSQGSQSQGSQSQGSQSQGSQSQGSQSQGSQSQGSQSQGSQSQGSQSQGSQSQGSQSQGSQSQRSEAEEEFADSEPTAERRESRADEAGDQREEQRGESRNSSSNRSSNGSSVLGKSISMIGGLIKILVMLALAAVVLVFLWANLDRIRQWWESLFAGQDEPSADSADELLSKTIEAPPRPFSSFRNPIGKESDLRRVVVITFQAFEAWAREQGTMRSKDETPSEFVRRASKAKPEASVPANQIVDAYNRIVYGRGKPTEKDLQAATEVWRVMGRAVRQ
jgi:hypothetical protein